MGTQQVTTRNLKYIAWLVSGIVIVLWLFLLALNGRYMFISMLGNDLILDKWTKTIYTYNGENKLERKINPKQNIKLNFIELNRILNDTSLKNTNE